jgi:hypothetical protein
LNITVDLQGQTLGNHVFENVFEKCKKAVCQQVRKMMKNSRDEQGTSVSLTPQLVFYLFFAKLQISCKE